jgi:hypothetical protein
MAESWMVDNGADDEGVARRTGEPLDGVDGIGASVSWVGAVDVGLASLVKALKTTGLNPWIRGTALDGSG